MVIALLRNVFAPSSAFDRPDLVRGGAQGDLWGCLFSLEHLLVKSKVSLRLLTLGWLLWWERSKSLLTQKNVSCEFVVLFPKAQCTCRQLPGLGPWGGCSPAEQEQILRDWWVVSRGLTMAS